MRKWAERRQTTTENRNNAAQEILTNQHVPFVSGDLFMSLSYVEGLGSIPLNHVFIILRSATAEVKIPVKSGKPVPGETPAFTKDVSFSITNIRSASLTMEIVEESMIGKQNSLAVHTVSLGHLPHEASVHRDVFRVIGKRKGKTKNEDNPPIYVVEMAWRFLARQDALDLRHVIPSLSKEELANMLLKMVDEVQGAEEVVRSMLPKQALAASRDEMRDGGSSAVTSEVSEGAESKDDSAPLIVAGRDFVVDERQCIGDANCPAVEDMSTTYNWYARMFIGRAHDNFVASVKDEIAIISILRSSGAGIQYWVIIWRKQNIGRYCVDSLHAPYTLTDVLALVDPPLAAAAAAGNVRRANAGLLEATLLKLENGDAVLGQAPRQTCKLGVLFAREGQTDETDMYQNEKGSPALDAFLQLLGTQVPLKGYTGYSAQLDTQNDQSGTHSVVCTFNGVEIMYHVSTLLRNDPTDEQRVQRKRFLGNDIVIILFMDGKTPFYTENMKSQYTNVVVCVQPAGGGHYRVATAVKKGVRPFGPMLSGVHKADKHFAALLVAKCLNGQRAAVVSPEFLVRERRTRQGYLKIIAEDVYPQCAPDQEFFASVAKGSSLARARSQVFTLVPASHPFQGHIRCMAKQRDCLWLGTDEGLFSGTADAGGKLEFMAVYQMERVKQIVVLPNNEDVAFIIGGAASDVHVIRTDKKRPSARILPGMSPCSKIACGADGRHLFVAIECEVKIIAIDREPFILEDTFRFSDVVTSLSLTSQGMVVGVSGLSNTSFSLLRKTWHWTTSPFIVPGALPPVKAVAAIDHPFGGLLLVFDTFCVRVGTAGRVSNSVEPFKWRGKPFHISVFGPYLIGFSLNMIEVLSIVNGAIIDEYVVPIGSIFTASSTVFCVPIAEGGEKQHVIHNLTLADKKVDSLFLEDECKPANVDVERIAKQDDMVAGGKGKKLRERLDSAFMLYVDQESLLSSFPGETSPTE